MPIWKKKPPVNAVVDSSEDPNSGQQQPNTNSRSSTKKSQSAVRSKPKVYEESTEIPADSNVRTPKLVFHCQQAQGSPTGIISGFTNVTELYNRIAECYDFPHTEILFCTLNTHKVDMTKLLGGQIGLDDFIFVHRKGQPKEIQITKTEDALGLTITDNGTGYAFVKRIKEGSIMDQINLVHVGDHIERINETSLVGWRHFEVAKFLKEIPKGSTFTMKLIEPLKAGFGNIGPRTDPRSGKKPDIGNGNKTLRLQSTGPAKVEEAPTAMTQKAVDKINNHLELFLGINDTDLAIQIWEIGRDKQNTLDFAEQLSKSDLAAFGFTEDFMFDLWGAISDAKAGRLQEQENNHF